MVNPNTYFLLVLRLSSNGQAQTWKALYINVIFSNDIKLIIFLLAALTVLCTRRSLLGQLHPYYRHVYIHVFIVHVVNYKAKSYVNDNTWSHTCALIPLCSNCDFYVNWKDFSLAIGICVKLGAQEGLQKYFGRHL